MMSPDGVFIVFEAPGTLLASPSFDYTSTVPHWMSIDQAGDITGSYTDTANGNGVIAGSYFCDWN
jgi:hypothetical protein